MIIKHQESCRRVVPDDMEPAGEESLLVMQYLLNDKYILIFLAFFNSF